MENKATRKLTPTHLLSAEQQHIKDHILRYCRQHVITEQPHLFLLEGDAGTGKSLLLSALFYALQKESRQNDSGPLSGSRNYLLVNHPEMLKLYRLLADEIPVFRKKDMERPTTFINKINQTDSRADIVLVDEAHLLLTRKDRYNHFLQDNQLEEIIRHSRIVILAFDPFQVLKFKSYWQQQLLEKITERFPREVMRLTETFRIQADHSTITWLSAFHRKQLLPIPDDPRYEIKIFSDPGALYRAVCAKNQEYGLCRLLSTYDYYYKLDGKDYFITEQGVHLRWDRSLPTEKLPWAERENTIEEVGSVYTIQGFDLNYAGVILGPSIDYDPAADRLVLDPARYEDQAAFRGNREIPEADRQDALENIMLNALNVLLTRGMHGLYIYASNLKLRNRLMELQPAK